MNAFIRVSDLVEYLPHQRWFSLKMSVSENDKRWLVVLVATDKIVAPLLRDFVAKGIDKLKDFLNDHLQNISTGYTLETMTYLLCHPPPPASPDPYLKYLKFQNINNNEGLSKVNYNYSVNNVVDLAKLYLPGYLAKFAAFDNSMDMSAALRLLGYSDYPTQVFVSSNPFLDIKSLADDVRNTVRNPGAHYNESIWTDLFMNQCFEKLVALVKAFVLPADQEKDALDQLHRWKSNGTVLSVLLYGFLSILSNPQRPEEKISMCEMIDISDRQTVVFFFCAGRI